MTSLSRRDILKLTRTGFLYLSGALAFGGLLRFLDFEPNPAPKTEFDLGPASNYPLNSRTILSDPPAVLFHHESGFSAMSLACTHLGCTVEEHDNGFVCPCHGSSFDSSGNVTHRPADKPLYSLRVEVTDNMHIVLHTA